MLNLIRNEWMKLWSKKGTWVMVIFLAVIIIGFTGLAKLAESMIDNTTWTETLEEDLTEIEKELASPDLTEREKVELEIQRDDKQEMAAISVQSTEPQVRESIILETYGIMAIVTLLTIIVAGGIVSTEFSQGTIKMLLSRPVSRWKVLASKYITVVLFCLLATGILYLSSVGSAYIFFPGSTESTVLFNNQALEISAVWGKSLYLLFLAFINAMIIGTIAFMLGVVFRSTSMAIGISMFLYFTGAMIVMFLSDYFFAKYLIFAHSNLTVHETGGAFFPELSMTFSVVVIVVYWVIFLALSFLSFMKRDVTA